MSIADQLTELVNQKKQLARNITEKGVQASEDETLNTLVPKVLEIDGGGGEGGISSIVGDVVFHDSYDNSAVNVYTKDEFAELTAMPQNPTHEGMVSQGWNWALSDAQRYVAKYGALDIGQMYITDDGTTRVYIHLQDGRTSPCVGLIVDGTATIDWGDGSSATTLTGTVADWEDVSSDAELFTEPHIYASAGNYVITITVSGKAAIGTINYHLDYESIGCSLLSDTYEQSHQNRVYFNSITAVEIGNNMALYNEAFGYCQNLERLTIPKECERVVSCFSSIKSPKSITIPDTWETLAYDFAYSENVENVNIPNSVTDMSGSFYSESGLTRLIIPDSVTTAYSGGLNGLQAVVIPENVSDITSDMFYENTTLKSAVVFSEGAAFERCTSLVGAKLGPALTKIESNMFYMCKNLKQITIPSSVTEIGENAFSECTRLQNVTIPSSVTIIKNGAFFACESMSKITIPSSVTEIESGAFDYACGLTEIRFMSAQPPTLGSGVFPADRASSIEVPYIIYVPNGSAAAYIEAGYPEDRIQEMN